MNEEIVKLIIVSPNGAFNGESADQQIQCHVREDGVIAYDLADWDREEQFLTGRVEHYEVTVTQVGVTEALEAEQSAQEE
ncbi:MAG: hypothetical protein ACTH7X_08935 [Brevibacterium aurantiacum]